MLVPAVGSTQHLSVPQPSAAVHVVADEELDSLLVDDADVVDLDDVADVELEAEELFELEAVAVWEVDDVAVPEFDSLLELAPPLHAGPVHWPLSALQIFEAAQTPLPVLVSSSQQI